MFTARCYASGVLRPLLLFLIAVPAVASARDGKVVRVERPFVKSGPIRICEISRDASGLCIGERAKPDDIIVVVDETQVLAEVRVVDVTNQGGTSCDAIWKFRGELLRGDVSGVSWARALGVIDSRLDRRSAHKLTEDKLPAAPSSEEHVIGAVARGSGPEPDIELTQYTCDANAQPTAQGGDVCFRLWSREGGGWKPQRETLVSSCIR